MRLDYDVTAGALYIRFTEQLVSKTVSIDDLTMVDLDAETHPVGIEVIDYDRVWPLEQILRTWSLPASDVDQLRALFPLLAPHEKKVTKTVEASLTASVEALPV